MCSAESRACWKRGRYDQTSRPCTRSRMRPRPGRTSPRTCQGFMGCRPVGRERQNAGHTARSCFVWPRNLPFAQREIGAMDSSPLKIGYCLSLSGALASNGKTARLAHEIWRENVNKNGGLLGRPVELVCLDDQTNPNLVADIYKRLIDVEKVDVVIGGYGDNSVAPAMPLIMERKKFFLGLMALAVNAKFHYPQYFVMIPTGPHPNLALTEGFFQIAGQQNPKPETVAILVADAPFSQSPTQPKKILRGKACGLSQKTSTPYQHLISSRTWKI